jgi:hypothetical protein
MSGTAPINGSSWRYLLVLEDEPSGNLQTLSGSSLALGRIHAHDPMLPFHGTTIEVRIGWNIAIRLVDGNEQVAP